MQGRERIPAHGPLIVTANHPNALVDALVVGTTVRRRVHLTAKAMLFENPLLAVLVRAVGVVPLRRAKDEPEGAGGESVSRNTAAFRMVPQALERQGAVLVFPETVRLAEALIARGEALEARLVERHATLADVHISPHLRHGVRFVLRESALTAVAFPIALLGRVTYWIPLRLARALALRTARDSSRDQPAMRTIALGLAFVLFWYAFLGVLFTRWFGGATAIPLLAAIFWQHAWMTCCATGASRLEGSAYSSRPSSRPGVSRVLALGDPTRRLPTHWRSKARSSRRLS